MAKLQYSGANPSSPRWMGQWGDRHSLIPGGGLLNIFTIPEVKGIRQLTSGSIIARTADQNRWDVVTPDGADGNTVLETTLTESVISGGRTIKVQSASGYKAGISIAVNGVNYTTQSVNTDTNTITLTAGVSTNLSKGVSVKLNNTVTYQEFYLTAFDVDNANEYADVELYRHGSIVYWDLLPYYSSLSNFYTNKLKTIYDCMRSN